MAEFGWHQKSHLMPLVHRSHQLLADSPIRSGEIQDLDTEVESDNSYVIETYLSSWQENNNKIGRMKLWNKIAHILILYISFFCVNF